MRHFRRVRASMAAAALRRAGPERPTPKRIKHIEDVMYENGLRFVRPGDPSRILGLTVEGVVYDKA